MYFLFSLYEGGKYKAGLLYDGIDLLPITDTQIKYTKDDLGRKLNLIHHGNDIYVSQSGLTMIAGTLADLCRRIHNTGWTIGCRRVVVEPDPEPLCYNSMAAIWDGLPNGIFSPLTFVDSADDFLGWYGKELSHE